jgi:hypothetical protein
MSMSTEDWADWYAGPEEQDEVVSDSAQPKKRVKYRRWNIPAQDLNTLEELYLKDQFPSVDTRRALADDLKVAPKRVQVWFQNKRQRAIKLEGSSEVPKVKHTLQQSDVFHTDEVEDQQEKHFPALHRSEGAASILMLQPERGGAEAQSSSSVPCRWPELPSAPPLYMMSRLHPGSSASLPNLPSEMPIWDALQRPFTLEDVSAEPASAPTAAPLSIESQMSSSMPPGMSQSQVFALARYAQLMMMYSHGMQPWGASRHNDPSAAYASMTAPGASTAAGGGGFSPQGDAMTQAVLQAMAASAPLPRPRENAELQAENAGLQASNKRLWSENARLQDDQRNNAGLQPDLASHGRERDRASSPSSHASSRAIEWEFLVDGAMDEMDAMEEQLLKSSEQQQQQQQQQ